MVGVRRGGLPLLRQSAEGNHPYPPFEGLRIAPGTVLGRGFRFGIEPGPVTHPTSPVPRLERGRLPALPGGAAGAFPGSRGGGTEACHMVLGRRAGRDGFRGRINPESVPHLVALSGDLARESGAGEAYCIFDNTAEGHAVPDALALMRMAGKSRGAGPGAMPGSAPGLFPISS